MRLRNSMKPVLRQRPPRFDADPDVDGPDERPARLTGIGLLYAGLAALLLLLVWLSVHYEGNEAVQRFAPDVATEVLSVLVTLAFVQRLLERQERARKLRAAVGALRKGRVALDALVELWAVLLKGSLDPRRTEYPRTVLKLFASYYTEELACLNPGIRPAPTASTWLHAATEQIASAQRTLRDVLLIYGNTLDAEYLEALDEVVDDAFLGMVRELAQTESLPPEEWRLRIARIRGHRETFFIRLAHAVRLHNRLAKECARFRSRHLAPRAASLALQLGGDRDLSLETEFPAGWWSAEPAVGSLRAVASRPPLSVPLGR